tara:strand:+ start:1350 stop:2165 length:816 start_codon:yes stop_codon:yes gene_type:complete
MKYLDESALNKYREDGYIVVDDIIDPSLCDTLNEYVQKNKSTNVDRTKEIDKDFPFSDILGTKVFINTLDEDSTSNPFSLINYGEITRKASFLAGQSMTPSFKKVYLKSAFQGDCEVYHQDYEYHMDKGGATHPFKDYIQCFIALEDHTALGGCLNIMRGSHKRGRIPHDLVMTRNGISKLTINPQVLKELSENDDFQPLHLKKGSCVFFSYITVHGSASNSSPFDQTRMVVEYMGESKRHDDEKTKTFLSRRRKQERGILQSMLDSLPPI